MKSSIREDSVNEDDHSAAKKEKTSNKDLLLNNIVYEEIFRTELKHVFRHEKECIKYDENLVFDTHPFKHCVLHNFVKDAYFLDNLKTELLQLKFQNKSNDLYKFQQSNDLKSSSNENIAKLRKLLYKDCLNWIKYITDIPLDENTIDMSCAKYSNTDVLLCHDDELEGRRIAYIFYLVPQNWSKADGGYLDLFATDDHGQPNKIVKSLIPSWNSFVFFEVTPISFHQVSEILSDKTRLSISGWFHGTSIIRPSPYKELAPVMHSPHYAEDEILISWINPLYLETETVEEIRHSFVENSEVQLQDFLLPNKYDELVKELSGENITWHMRGPSNKRQYENIMTNSLSETVQECYKLFKSEPMFRLLTTLTGLKLSDVNIEDEDKSDNDELQRDTISEDGSKTKQTETGEHTYCCHGEVCRWSHGCYTLIHDYDPEISEMALDALFFIACDGWKEDFGGFTSYLAKEEDEELLTVQPCPNSLALVYRDKDTLKFVKHINNKCTEEAASSTKQNLGYYYNFIFTYFE